MAFDLYLCDSTQESLVLVFRNGDGAARRIAFMDSYREFALKSPTTKGILKWSDTIAIHINNWPQNKNRKIIAIEYRDSDDGSIHDFEGGFIDEQCLGQIRQRYGSALNIREEIR